jgi:hypothetical protein
MYRARRPRHLDVDIEPTEAIVCLVQRVPAWFHVKAYGVIVKVNIDTPGKWIFYKEITRYGEELLQVIRES